MPHLKTLAASFISLTALTSPTWADLTGADVWDDWKAYMQGFGYEMTGTETQSGNVLSVSDVSMSMTMPEGTFNLSMPGLSFTEIGNGSVSVDLPAVMPIVFDMKLPEGENAKGSVIYTQDAPTMIVSGDPEDLTYTYSANRADMSLGDITVDGQTFGQDLFRMAVTMADIANVTRMTSGALRNYSQTMSVKQLTYDIAFANPAGPDRFDMKGAANDLSFDGTGTLPEAGTFDPEDFAMMLEAGLSLDGGFSYSSGNSTIAAVSPDGPFNGQNTSGGGSVQINMSKDQLSYSGEIADAASTMQTPQLPFPVSTLIKKGAFNLAIPISPSDDPQDFAFGFTLGDFTMSDMIWSMFDPGEQLPRDPATISLNLTGTAKVTDNFMDPAAMANPNASPGELNSLDIGSLLVRLAGAQLSGSGGFTFDNSDTTTFDGMPKPTGSVDLQLLGANALIDKLVNMGLLPQEQAMGARMMMGLFTVPQGDDALASTIEINEQGHVLANGQRLR